VTGAHGKSYRAFTYYATCIDPCLRPFHWYLEHVIRGAIEHRLRDEYIAAIRAIASVGDPVPGRHDCELAIYCAGLPPGTTALHCGHGNKAFDGRPPAGMRNRAAKICAPCARNASRWNAIRKQMQSPRARAGSVERCCPPEHQHAVPKRAPT